MRRFLVRPSHGFAQPSPTQKHAACPFCNRTVVAIKREPVARRDRIVVSTLRCGRSNPGSNPGHGSPSPPRGG
ncbi:hypothetical protein M9458_050296, partial [Cirrhinus mrigala]